MTEYCHKIEEVKAMQSKIKENVQGINSDGKEIGIQTSDLEQKEEININQNRIKKEEFKIMRRGLGTSRTSLNIPTSES